MGLYIRVYTISILFTFITTISLAQTTPDVILGKWITTSGNCIVEVYKQNQEFKAKILWFKATKKPMDDWTDEKNSNIALRKRKLLGMDVVRGLRYNSDEKQWVDGMIYDATTGKEWNSIVWLTKDNLLKVKGYWLFRFLSETKTFKRV